MSNNSTATAAKTPKGVRTAAAFDPRSPGLVQPFKRLIEEGYITEMRVTFTPTGCTVVAKPDARIAGVEGSGLVAGTDSPVGQIAVAADKGNLIPRKGKDKKAGASAPAQPLPAKTLVPEDFDKTDAEFLGRARAVAQAAGGTALVGRVRSAGLFDGTVTISFQKWWDNATYAHRAASLVQKKFLDKMQENGGPAKIRAKFESLQCPFRGIADFKISEEEEDDEPAIKAGPSSPKK